MRRASVAGFIGLAVTVVTFVALKELTRDWWAFASRSSQDRGYAIGLLVVGAGIAVVALAAQYHPLITAVPAGLLFVTYTPLFFNVSVPAWYPEWFRRDILVSYSPALYLVVAAFATASVWHLTTRRNTPQPQDHSVSGPSNETPAE